MKFLKCTPKTLKGAAALLAIAALSASCSKDDNNSPLPGITTKTGKFIISVKDINISESDDVHFTFAGSDGTLNGTCWKVNGVTRENEPAVSITETDLLSGNDIVIETAKPLVSASVSISIVNFDTPVKLKFTPSFQGSTQGPINETVTDTYIKQFTY